MLTDDQVEERLARMVLELRTLMEQATLNPKQDRFVRTAYQQLGRGLVVTILKKVGGRI